jgi:hypothetical protein
MKTLPPGGATMDELRRVLSNGSLRWLDHRRSQVRRETQMLCSERSGSTSITVGASVPRRLGRGPERFKLTKPCSSAPNA